MSYITDDLFGVEGQIIEEVTLDEEAEAKKYALSLYERLRRIESGSLTEEVVSSSSRSSISSSIVFSEDSFSGELPHPYDASKIELVEILDQSVPIPVFSTQKAKKRWNDVLDHHDAKVRRVIQNLLTLRSQKAEELKDRIQAINNAVMEWTPKTRAKEDVDMKRRTLRLKMVEELINTEIGQLAYTVKDLSVIIDKTTSGIWAQCPQKEGQNILQSMSTRRIVLTNQFNFDANQTENLVNFLFSSKSDVRAKAKLNLSARLSQDKYQQIIYDPDRILEIVFAEAMITQEEALNLVFPRSEKSDARYCPQCNTSVEINRAIYHRKCKVVVWLSKHCRFNYDEGDQCLTAKEFVYINSDKRRLLVEILELHAQLRRDIIKNTATETIIWQRQDNGELRRIPIRSQREEDLIGSLAWRKKHGF